MQQKSLDLSALATAVRAQTILPWRCQTGTAVGAARAAFYLPLVGLGVGLAAAMVHGLAIAAHLPSNAAVIAAMATMIALEGLRQERALAQVADAVAMGKREFEARDCHGTPGMGALVFGLLLKFVLLSWLPPRQCERALMVGGVAKAWMGLALRQTLEWQGEGEWSELLRSRLDRTEFWMLTLGCSVATLWLGRWAALAAVALCGCAWFATALLAEARFGGLRETSARLGGTVAEWGVYWAAAMY